MCRERLSRQRVVLASNSNDDNEDERCVGNDEVDKEQCQHLTATTTTRTNDVSGNDEVHQVQGQYPTTATTMRTTTNHASGTTIGCRRRRRREPFAQSGGHCERHGERDEQGSKLPRQKDFAQIVWKLLCDEMFCSWFVGQEQGKFSFIIEYSSLRDFGPQANSQVYFYMRIV